MTSLNKIFLWGAVGIVAAAFYNFSGDDKPAVKNPPPAIKTTPKTQGEDEVTEADYHVRFDHPKAKLRNVFLPGGGAENEIGIQPMDIDHIPAELAGGESNWTFTGLAQIDGSMMALLENSEKHQGGFVKQGEHWKGALVKKITPESIVLVDSDGTEQVIMRFNPNKPTKNAAAAPVAQVPGALPAVTPQAPPPGPPPGMRMRGRIGGGVVISSDGGASVVVSGPGG